MRTLMDMQATGEISEREADDIHESLMQDLELQFLIRQEKTKEKMVEVFHNKTTC